MLVHLGLKRFRSSLARGNRRRENRWPRGWGRQWVLVILSAFCNAVRVWLKERLQIGVIIDIILLILCLT